MPLPNAEQYKECLDCDGSCIGSPICGPDGLAVCCACKRPGCLLTIKEYNNPLEACREKRDKAVEEIAEIERELFGEEA